MPLVPAPLRPSPALPKPGVLVAEKQEEQIGFRRCKFGSGYGPCTCSICDQPICFNHTAFSDILSLCTDGGTEGCFEKLSGLRSKH